MNDQDSIHLPQVYNVSQTENPKPSPKLRNDNHRWLILKWSIIFIAVTLSIFILAITWLFLSVFIDKAFQSKPVSVKPSLISSPTPDLYREPTGSAATANWKTYRNEKFRYSVQYPSGWEVIEAKLKSGHETETLIKEENEIQKVTFLEEDPKLYQGRFQIRVLSNPNNLTLEQWVKDYKIPLLADPSISLAKVVGNTTLNGKAAKEISINTLTVPKEMAITTMNNNYIYYVKFDNWNDIETDKIAAYGAEKLIQINNRILSTFQFTN